MLSYGNILFKDVSLRGCRLKTVTKLSNCLLIGVFKTNLIKILPICDYKLLFVSFYLRKLFRSNDAPNY